MNPIVYVLLVVLFYREFIYYYLHFIYFMMNIAKRPAEPFNFDFDLVTQPNGHDARSHRCPSSCPSSSFNFRSRIHKDDGNPS